MTDNLKHLRSRLEDEQKLLRRELQELKSSSETPEERREGSPFGKREEEATENMELEKRLALEKRLGGNLTEIEHALRKFEDGTYGKCDVCGLPIPAERLEALPQASLCMTCKAKNEKGKVSAG